MRKEPQRARKTDDRLWKECLPGSEEIDLMHAYPFPGYAVCPFSMIIGCVHSSCIIYAAVNCFFICRFFVTPCFMD